MNELTSSMKTIVAAAMAIFLGSTLQGATPFLEDFSSGTLPPQLERSGVVGATCCSGQVGGSVFENGEVRFTGRDSRGDGSGHLRSYLRTIDDDYASVCFVAEATTHVGPNPAGVARDIVFFGLGAVSQPFGNSGEPVDGIQIQVRPDRFFPSAAVVDHNVMGVTADADNTCGGDGTHRVRLEWSADLKRAVVSVDQDYVSGPFVADCTLPPVDGSNNGFGGSVASRIYIGGDWDNRFDDFQVQVDSDCNGVFDDAAGPLTSDVMANPNPASMDELVMISAVVSDATTGNSAIASAECELTNTSTEPTTVVPCGPAIAADSSFDSPTEDVQATIAAGTLDPGVYELCVRGTDAEGNPGDFDQENACTLLVIYDPDGGFVTGGGWIDSPAGADKRAGNETLSGKANFGFVSKYKKGANVPTGNTQFQFKAGDLTFKSTEYEWLVIAGPQAKYKGLGTINGTGNYGFMLTGKDAAINGGPDNDTFRIKIWDKDAGDGVVYDNGTDQEIDQGSIKIHQK